MGAGVPIIPVAVWGSQRIITKKRKPDFKRRKHPVHVAFGEPYLVPKGSDVEAAEAELKVKMLKLLHSVQSNYPHTHDGQWWAPARLGGTAISSEDLQEERRNQRNTKEQENG
jgi:1-acyl-sn-glycerol-3-phosphate acyltransferase